MQRGNGLSLDADLERRIEACARAAAMTANEVVRRALDQYEAALGRSSSGSAEEESVFETLDRAGIIGCLKGGPEDLSTNPTYMDGFGGA